jgi:tripartite-type tricarboxylate transporter receptor subunit TctC
MTIFTRKQEMKQRKPRRARGMLTATAVVAAGAMLGDAVPQAYAQSYPAKPIRIIAASSPGSGVDIVARAVAQKLTEQIGQQVIVDNRAGAGGNLGAEIAAKAPADGYTLFMATPAHAINTGLYRRLTYDLVRDFAPISLLTTGHYVIVVHSSIPVKSVKELIAFARVRPGEINYASAGLGNATHLAAELFNSMANVKLVHVPYKGGGPALIETIAGQVQLTWANLVSGLPHVKSGRLRGLAVTGEKRSTAAPELPTVSEAGLPGYTVRAWYGAMVPSGTPPEVITRLNSELTRAMSAPELRARFTAQGADPATDTPDQFGAFLKAEISMWTKVVRDANITAE